MIMELLFLFRMAYLWSFCMFEKEISLYFVKPQLLGVLLQLKLALTDTGKNTCKFAYNFGDVRVPWIPN